MTKEKEMSGKQVQTLTSALRGLVEGLKMAFEISEVVGHRDLSHNKECPCFDVKTEL